METYAHTRTQTRHTHVHTCYRYVLDTLIHRYRQTYRETDVCESMCAGQTNTHGNRGELLLYVYLDGVSCNNKQRLVDPGDPVVLSCYKRHKVLIWGDACMIQHDYRGVCVELSGSGSKTPTQVWAAPGGGPWPNVEMMKV